MQINGFTKIVIFVDSLGFTLFGCIALFDFFILLGFTVAFALFVRMRLGCFAPAGATRTLSLDPASL